LALLRKATLGDVPEMTRLERVCPTAAHWTEQQYHDLLGEKAPTRVAFIAQKDGGSEAAGFLIAHHLPPEWELENIVVAEKCRRNGIGTQLMQAFLVHATKMHGESVLLEVRESNTAARALYERLGFQQTGRRKSYYSAPLEDAVLYSKDLRMERNSG
jgi:[ribosomal protein S18]-alanine N-acetyltransferase